MSPNTNYVSNVLIVVHLNQGRYDVPISVIKEVSGLQSGKLKK